MIKNAARAATLSFVQTPGYSHISEDDLQHLYSTVSGAIEFVEGVNAAVLENHGPSIAGRGRYDREEAAAAIAEVAVVLHGLKTANDKICDAIQFYDDADGDDEDTEVDEAGGGEAAAPFVSRASGSAADLGELGWINLYGPREAVDHALDRIRGVKLPTECDDGTQFTLPPDTYVGSMASIRAALRGVPREVRERVLWALGDWSAL